MLVIIECKTYGGEFDKYYKKTIADGDQLFSYWQQERATKWLVLYASDLSDDEIIYKAPTISCTDYKSVLESAKKDIFGFQGTIRLPPAARYQSARFPSRTGRCCASLT